MTLPQGSPDRQTPPAKPKRKLFAAVARLVGLKHSQPPHSPTSAPEAGNRTFPGTIDHEEDSLSDSLSDSDAPAPLLIETFSELGTSQVIDCQGKSQTVTFEVMKKKDRQELSMREQGNLKYYRPEELEKRDGIRESKQLRELFRGYYDQLAKGEDCIQQRGYNWLYKKLYWKLYPKGNREECEQLAQAEWETETQGTNKMSFEMFYESMFTFVDLWCPSASEQQYLAWARGFFVPIMGLITSDFQNQPTLGRESIYQTTKAVVQVFTQPLVQIKQSDQRIDDMKASGQRESSQSWYQKECVRLSGDVQKPVEKALSSTGFGMTKVCLKSMGIKSILPLLDVLRLNTDLEVLDLSENMIRSNDFQLLFMVLQTCTHLKSLEISNNPVCPARALSGLHRLLIRNPNICKIGIRGTVPSASSRQLFLQVDYNYHCTHLTRDDYCYLKSAFKLLDKDGGGTVDRGELLEYLCSGKDFDHKAMFELGGKPTDVLNRNDSMGTPFSRTKSLTLKRQSATSLRRKSSSRKSLGGSRRHSSKTGDALTVAKAAKVTEYRSQKRAEAMLEQMISKHDANGDSEFSFHEFLRMFYPKMSLPVIEKISKRHETSESWLLGGATLADLEDVFEECDTDGSGTLDWDELKTGIQRMNDGDHIWERVEKHLPKYDLNGDQQLSLEEFVLLVTALEEGETISG